MPMIHITQPDSQQVNVEVPIGTSVMRAAVDAAVCGIIGECGGAAMCGTCHVFVAPEWFHRLGPVRRNEDDLLDCTATPRQPNSRLGCQLRMTEEMAGLVLTLPERQR